MGTTTFYLRHNDIGRSLHSMKKSELKQMDKLSPYREDNHFMGWRTPLELHNGNVYVLIWWKGRLMKLEDAPKELTRKYWDKYRGKTHNIYEWTLLRRLLLNQVEWLDKEFKKSIRRKHD